MDVVRKMEDCMDPTLNPSYPGRKPTPTTIYDGDCDKTIEIKYGDQETVKNIVHKVGQDKMCLVTINNFSGKTYEVVVETEANDDKFKIFRLDNTDEMWWKTIKKLEDAVPAEGPGVDQKNFKILSGTGKGVYAFSLDSDNVNTFITKITQIS